MVILVVMVMVLEDVGVVELEEEEECGRSH
jgi:hypothetical protein